MKQGWREFVCHGCGHAFTLPCRDHTSPSVEVCPQCQEYVSPTANRADPLIPVDAFGNLIPGHQYVQ